MAATASGGRVPRRVRMLCLGDSLTEGLTVEGMEEVLHPYSGLLGRLLAARLRTAATAGNAADSARKKECVGTQECQRPGAAAAIDLVNAGVVRSVRHHRATLQPHRAQPRRAEPCDPWPTRGDSLAPSSA